MKGRKRARATGRTDPAWRGLALLGVLAALLMAGCGGGSNGTIGPANQATPGTYVGDTQSLGNGTIRSYVTIDANGRPASVGVVLTAAALNGLSDTINTSNVLNLPVEAQTTVLNHIEVTYQPTGHAPPGIYDVPQFDVSFFRVSQQERQAFQTVGQTNFDMAYKVPDAEHVPPTYFLEPGSAVPTFGAQEVFFQAPELVGKGFTLSTNYLYYNATMVGIQPLVGTSFLKQHVNRVDDIETPLKFPIGGFWPSKTAVRYDAGTQEYTIALEGFVSR